MRRKAISPAGCMKALICGRTAPSTQRTGAEAAEVASMASTRTLGEDNTETLRYLAIDSNQEEALEEEVSMAEVSVEEAFKVEALEEEEDHLNSNYQLTDQSNNSTLNTNHSNGFDDWDNHSEENFHNHYQRSRYGHYHY